jgi:hypothetical protein
MNSNGIRLFKLSPAYRRASRAKQRLFRVNVVSNKDKLNAVTTVKNNNDNTTLMHTIQLSNKSNTASTYCIICINKAHNCQYLNCNRVWLIQHNIVCCSCLFCLFDYLFVVVQEDDIFKTYN